MTKIGLKKGNTKLILKKDNLVFPMSLCHAGRIILNDIIKIKTEPVRVPFCIYCVGF